MCWTNFSLLHVLFIAIKSKILFYSKLRYHVLKSFNTTPY